MYNSDWVKKKTLSIFISWYLRCDFHRNFPCAWLLFLECVKYGHKTQHTIASLGGGVNIHTHYHRSCRNIAILHCCDMFQGTDGTLDQHRHLTIKDPPPPSLVQKSNKRKTLQFLNSCSLGKKIQTCCYFMTTLHHFLLLRRVEGKKAPSPSLCGEPHGLSSPQLMSSQDSSLSHERKPILQNGQETIDACSLLPIQS